VTFFQLNIKSIRLMWQNDFRGNNLSVSRRLHQLPQSPLRVGSDHIALASTVLDLEIYIDSDVSMRSQVAKTVSTCYSVLRQLRTIRRSVFFSRWCRFSSSHGWTTAIRHSPAFHHISCHGCSQWWTPLLGLSFPRQGSSTSLRSFVRCTGWRLQRGLHWNNQSSCTGVYTGPHLHTLLTSFVRWQMSRLVSDSVPVHPHHWLSAAPDSLPSVTELSRSPLHVSGTVCQILSLQHLP